MALKLQYLPYNLKFKFDAGTSRGVLREKEVWYIKVFDEDHPKIFGLGEVATIERLSLDYDISFEEELEKLSAAIKEKRLPGTEEEVYELVQELVKVEHPSIAFALETALLDLMHGGRRLIFENNFYQGKSRIPINGLIWMGEKDFMKEQIDAKLRSGFTCLKVKIAALDFQDELELLRYIRSNYPKEKLTLRVDANGGFRTEDCMLRMKALEEFDLHSIEQPIMPKQSEAMSLLCKKTNIPIGLDEELIGISDIHEKEQLLNDIQPAYIILKPGLIGGFRSTKEWIELAESKDIGWWITSALESNVGLNVICQFTAKYEPADHQGLGTGQLFENNIESPLSIAGEYVSYSLKGSWDLTRLEFSG
ncbi:MAG: o-succinylbenzoate synthase [Cyclobacteriaceae bacterium]